MALKLWLEPKRFKDLKKQVESVLAMFPDTRNSDTLLTQTIWFNYYKGLLKRSENEIYVSFKRMYDLPSQDDVKRIRAKIQNPDPSENYAGKYPPTIWEVAKKRKWNEAEWRGQLGYNPEMLTPEQVADEIGGKVGDEITIN